MKARIAVAQIDAAVGDLAANVARHAAFVRAAHRKGADMVVFPELSLTGYSVRDLNWDLAISLKDPSPLRPLIRLSHGITIVAGGIEEGDDFGLYNTAFVIEDGRVHAAHRKIYLPTYGMFEEMRYFSAGRTLNCFHSKLGRLGVLICEDLWHVALPYVLAHDGAEIIIGLSASPTRLSGKSETLQNASINAEHHRTYARLLSTYLAFANRVGVEDGVTFWGGSAVFDPSGNPVASAKLFEEDLILASVDDRNIRRARRFSRHFIDDEPTLVVQQLLRALGRHP